MNRKTITFVKSTLKSPLLVHEQTPTQLLFPKILEFQFEQEILSKTERAWCDASIQRHKCSIRSVSRAKRTCWLIPCKLVLLLDFIIFFGNGRFQESSLFAKRFWGIVWFPNYFETFFRFASIFNILIILGFTIYSCIKNIHTNRLLISGCPAH